MKPEEINNYISLEAGIRFGKPTLRGTRITVEDVLEMLANMSRAEIAEAFPKITDVQIQACLLFAARRERLIAA